MSNKKIQRFVLSIVLILMSYGCEDMMKQKNDETVCRFFLGFNADVSWETYRITSEKGLLEVDLWVERHIDYLKYPYENLEIIPSEIYCRRNDKRIYYPILSSVPIDTTKPKASQKFKPHISNESIDELKNMTKKYGIEMSTQEFDLFAKRWWYKGQ